LAPKSVSNSAGNRPQHQPKIRWKSGQKMATKLYPKLALNHPKICWNTYICVKSWNHGRIARGGHRLLTISPGPAMPYPSTPCRRAIPETPFSSFRGGPLSGRATYCQLLPLLTTHAIHLWFDPKYH
jgi:hypothetical protein